MSSNGNLMELVDTCAPVTHNNEKVQAALMKARELASLGFKTVADTLLQKAQLEEKLNTLAQYKYVAITPEKINKFLQAKADAYNAEHAKSRADCDTQAGSYSDDAVVYYNRLGPESFSSASLDSGWYWSSHRTFLSPATPLGSMYGTIAPPPVQQDEIPEVRTCDVASMKKGTIGRYRWNEVTTDKYKTLPPANVLDTFKTHKSRKVFDYFTVASVEGIHDPLLLGRLKGDTTRYFIAQWGDDIKLDEVI